MFTLLDGGPYKCGETPIWREDENAVYWVDAASHAVYAYSFSDRSVRKYQPEVPVSAIRSAPDGRFYLLCKYGLYLWSPLPGSSQGKIHAGKDVLDPAGSIRFNDGIPIGSSGFVAGAFDEGDLHSGNGYLYFLTLEGLCIVVDDHLHVPNGVAVTGDGETLYMAEMYKNRILSYSIGCDKKTFFNKQVHISIPDLHGKPDGLLCDADGNLWVAHWRGWQVSRYDRHGHQNLVISTPFATPTCLCWKGSAEKEMIVTTATLELSADELRNSQHPGAVYLLRL